MWGRACDRGACIRDWNPKTPTTNSLVRPIREKSGSPATHSSSKKFRAPFLKSDFHHGHPPTIPVTRPRSPRRHPETSMDRNRCCLQNFFSESNRGRQNLFHKVNSLFFFAKSVRSICLSCTTKDAVLTIRIRDGDSRCLSSGIGPGASEPQVSDQAPMYALVKIGHGIVRAEFRLFSPIKLIFSVREGWAQFGKSRQISRRS
jgi:hypothetical protein